MSNSLVVFVTFLIEYNTAVLGKTLQYCLLGVWFILSIGILSWGSWPRPQASHHLSVPGYGKIILKWDSNTPTGDISVIELSFDLGEKDNRAVNYKPSKMISSAIVYQQRGVSSDDLNVELAEARLELPDLDVKPFGIFGQTFRPGGEVVFFWNATSDIEGDFQGRVWLYIVTKSLPGDIGSRYPIAIQPIELRWRDLFGLSGTAARYVGLSGLIIGLLVGIVIQLKGRKLLCKRGAHL